MTKAPTPKPVAAPPLGGEATPPVDPNPNDNVTVADNVPPPPPIPEGNGVPAGGEGAEPAEEGEGEQPKPEIAPNKEGNGPGPASFKDADEDVHNAGVVNATPTPEGSRSAVDGDDPKVRKSLGTKTASGQELTVGPNERSPATRPDVVPSLEVASREAGIAGSELRRDPLDHDGNGRKGGAVPAGRVGSYEQVASERDKLKDENEALRSYIEEHAGQKGVDAALKSVKQGSGSKYTASGSPIVPPQNIDDLRTPGINDTP